MQRRLMTIVAADIAGFSRLVGVEEEGTRAARRESEVKNIAQPVRVFRVSLEEVAPGGAAGVDRKR